MNRSTQQTRERLHSLLMEGDAHKAELEIRKFLKKNSDDDIGLMLLGHSLNKQEKSQEAIKYFKQTVKLEPRHSEVWHILGNLLMAKGEKAEGLECFKKSINYDPFQGEIRKIRIAINERNIQLATQICLQVLDRHNDHPQALMSMIEIATLAGAYEDARSMLRQGLAHSPYNIIFWFKLVETLAALGEHHERIKAAQKTFELEPELVQTSALLGDALAKAGLYDRALEAYAHGLEIDGNDANTLLQYGHMLKTLGRREECERAYRKSLKLQGFDGAAYWAMADLKDFKFSDHDLKEMKAILKGESASAAQASQAGFAIAKAYEDMEEFDTAFEYYATANSLKPNITFNGNNFNDHINKIWATYSKESLRNQAVRQALPKAIFILGLPRAGSTLVEQILASHSQVEGTDELVNLPLISRLMDRIARKNGMDLTDYLKSFSVKELNNYGQKYLDDTAIYRSGKPYFIDKLPSNFLCIGLIHMILPNAIIIDVRRHPLDNGFSTYKQHFAVGNDFSYDLEHIGHYYNGYLKLMDYWDTVLPGKVHCLCYERLVENSEQEVRRLLGHCQLEFEENCLNFYKNKRAVNTPSSEQVRQPINSKGIGYWHNFEKHLQPFKNALGTETLKRFNN